MTFVLWQVISDRKAQLARLSSIQQKLTQPNTILPK
jgi:hypothetical protein